MDDLYNIFQEIAIGLKLSNAPYGRNFRIELLDDLIEASRYAPGLLIIVDNADKFFLKKEKDIFDFIEVFLLQSYHWYKSEKPCHLCFQMNHSDLLIPS